MKTLINCLMVKILCVVNIIVCIGVVPYMCYTSPNKIDTIGQWVALFVIELCMTCIILLCLKGIKSTNNPLTPNNIFSINPKFSNKMKHSFSEAGLDCIELPTATEEEKLEYERNKKLSKILDIK